MKLGILGDLHIHSKAPKRRIDADYLRTCEIKLYKALRVLEDCDVIIQVGDFFDSYAVSNRVIAMTIRILRSARRTIYCVYGQHDIASHAASTMDNSPLKVLMDAGVVRLLDACPTSTGTGDDFITMYGAPFGAEIPEVTTKGFTILVTHRMIGDRPLYPGQELERPRAFLRYHPEFDLVCCGDYHYRFDDGIQDRVILNPGVMMRKTLKEAELEHEPAVYTFDTQTRKFKIISVPCEPIEEVMNLDVEDKRIPIALAEFMQKLQMGKAGQVGWKNILLGVMDSRGASKDVRKVIDESMMKLEERNGKHR
jgi:DNA repair exonuclease SbcCD nuclease subunit